MSLATARIEGPPARNGYYNRGCAVGRWAATLPPSEREALDAILSLDSGWRHIDVAEWIRDDKDYPGVEFPELMISRHRRAGCSCAR